MAFGRRGTCEVLAVGLLFPGSQDVWQGVWREDAQAGWQADALRRLAPPDATIAVVGADGAVIRNSKSAFLAGWMRQRLRSWLGSGNPEQSRFAIIARPECHLVVGDAPAHPAAAAIGTY